MCVHFVHVHVSCNIHCTCTSTCIWMVSGDGVQVEMPEFECGDVVRMISDMAEAYRLQQGHGEWNDDLALVCVCTCTCTLCVHFCA